MDRNESQQHSFQDAAPESESLGLTQDLERIQKIATYVYLVFYLVPLSVTSVLALSRGEQVLGYTLGAFASTAVFVMWRVHRHGLQFGSRAFIVVAAIALFLFLVSSGGYANTGLFWCFALFVVVFHLCSPTTGLIVSFVLLTLSAVLLYSEGLAGLHPDYPPAVANRVLITGSVTCILLYAFALVQEALKNRLQVTQERVLQMSMTDELTGLTNRRSMKEVLREHDKRKPGERSLAIVIADVDHFKAVNDSLGHDAGDQILVHISQVLQEALRDTDRVARWGGEEFLILLDVMDLSEAEAIVERARQKVEDTPAVYEGRPVRVTISFGIRAVTGPAESLQQAIVAADRNLLRAKELGRNRVIAS